MDTCEMVEILEESMNQILENRQKEINEFMATGKLTYNIFVRAVNDKIDDVIHENEKKGIDRKEYFKTLRDLNEKILEWWDECELRKEESYHDSVLGKYYYSLHTELVDAYNDYIDGNIDGYFDHMNNVESIQRRVSMLFVGNLSGQVEENIVRPFDRFIQEMPEEFDLEEEKYGLSKYIIPTEV